MFFRFLTGWFFGFPADLFLGLRFPAGLLRGPLPVLFCSEHGGLPEFQAGSIQQWERILVGRVKAGDPFKRLCRLFPPACIDLT